MHWVNSSFSQTSPVLFKDQIIFLVDKQTTAMRKVISAASGKPVKIFNVISKNAEGKYDGSALNYALELASPAERTSFVLNKQGNRMYLAKSRIENDFNGKTKNTFGIFESALQSSGWTAPQEISILNDSSGRGDSEMPALSLDGKTLYFVSNAKWPGAMGGTDIWYSELKGGRWTRPKNMGPPVNSDKNEYCPVVNPDGRLYFSSDRTDLVNLGKTDIYYTEWINGAWVSPVHLGSPFNSASNDFSLVLADANFNNGFFCSDRASRKISNIYSFEANFPDFPDKQAWKKLKLCYKIKESEGVAIDTNLTMWEWEFDDSTRVRALTARHCFPGTGVYSINLNVYDKVSKKVSRRQATYTLNVDSIEQPGFDCKDTLSVNELFNFSANGSYTPHLASCIYYWDFGDGNHASGYQVGHRYKKPGKYKVLLGIKGKPTEDGYPDRMASYREIEVLR